jgi:hypothetical protein
MSPLGEHTTAPPPAAAKEEGNKEEDEVSAKSSISITYFISLYIDLLSLFPL